MLVRHHQTYRRQYNISDHAITQLRERSTNVEVKKLMTDLDLRIAVDRQLAEAWQSHKFEVFRYLGEPIWLVPFWDKFAGLNGILRNDRHRLSSHCEKALVTVFTDEIVARNKAGKHEVRWFDFEENKLTFKLGDKLSLVNVDKAPVVQQSLPAEGLPMLQKPTPNTVGKDVWAINYPVDDEVGEKWEKVEGAAKALERVSQLVELGIEASTIVVFKPVRKKVSVTFDDT